MAFNYNPYSGYNPMMPYMPQNNQPIMPAQMPAQASSTAGNINTQPLQQNGFICRPVTSRLEAEAVQVDFLGPGTIMPDLAHGTIYLKRFNSNTGASDFIVFEVQQPAPEPAPVQYATLDDIKSIRTEIEALKKGVAEE